MNVVTDDENHVLSAYDVARYLYEKTRNIDIFREMNEDFFYMFDILECKMSIEEPLDIERKQR